MPDVGDLIGDRYRLAGRIAGGGMGEVWRAEDETLNRPVAVKLLRAHISAESSAGERFRSEARAMAALRHPGVADVYDYGEADQPDGWRLAYIVMAYVGGQPLSARIAADQVGEPVSGKSCHTFTTQRLALDQLPHKR